MKITSVAGRLGSIAALSAGGFGIATLSAAMPVNPAGASTVSCADFSVTGAWTVDQSNVGNFGLDLVQSGSTISGTATYGSGGTVSGTLTGNALDVQINWGGNLIGHYTATVSANALTDGYTYQVGLPSNNATWSATGSTSCTTPQTTAQCKNGGWTGYVDAQGNVFKNQGDCVSFVASGGKSDPS